MHKMLSELGASPVINPGLGDDSRDMDRTFAEWQGQLLPALCEYYAAASTVDTAASATSNTDGCGTCASGTTDSSDVYRKPASWEEFEDAQRRSADPQSMTQTTRRLPLKEYRRLKRLKKQAEGLASEAGSEAGGLDDDAMTEASLMELEEDRLNEMALHDDEWDSDEDGESKTAESGGGGGSGGSGGEEGLVDLEDIGAVMKKGQREAAAARAGPPGEMVTPAQRRSLTKEGYDIIGTHSAVKLCRWTKHQLRGRGGCYKHTFYGITSYQCMETTPSLACANKCVFCWRHHKNPVGKEWRWKVDDPREIVDQSIAKHRRMINAMRGVPGVKMERFNEAFNVKHCALSLVGEPIMYVHLSRHC